MTTVDYMYSGDVLAVDLDARTTEQIDPEELGETKPGLAGGMRMLVEYSSGDPLVFGSGLLTGTTVPASCLGFILGESPLNGRPAVAPLDLYAGAEMKLSGFRMVIIKGKSAEPVYLWLHDGVADIVDASGLKGRDTWETCDAIRSEMGENLIQVISTGSAGEEGSKLASACINYWGSGDTAALGAVMGEKNLKAVALRGLGMIDASDPELFYERSLELTAESSQEKGFGGICRALGADDLDSWLKPVTHRFRSCFACPCACGTFVKYNEPPTVMESSDVPEPGMLVTSAAASLWLMKGGWRPDAACRAMESMARAGIDAVRGSREIYSRPIEDQEEIDSAVSGLRGTEKAGWPDGKFDVDEGLFGPWVPPVAGEKEWSAANRAGYLLGVCPTYILLSGIDVTKLTGLAGPAAGIELDEEAVEKMFE